MFTDRAAAGRQLADLLRGRFLDRPVVLAVPRGGVPVGAEIARGLGCPLELLIVRKIGVPGQPELAAAAIVDGAHPQIIRNESIIRAAGLAESELRRLAGIQLAEILRRRRVYAGEREPLSVTGRTAIVADDGIATGASMKAAILGLRKQEPKSILVAVPVAPVETIHELETIADEVVCLDMPSPFFAIGPHYADFHQLSDQEVMTYMASNVEVSQKR